MNETNPYMAPPSLPRQAVVLLDDLPSSKYVKEWIQISSIYLSIPRESILPGLAVNDIYPQLGNTIPNECPLYPNDLLRVRSSSLTHRWKNYLIYSSLAATFIREYEQHSDDVTWLWEELIHMSKRVRSQENSWISKKRAQGTLVQTYTEQQIPHVMSPILIFPVAKNEVVLYHLGQAVPNFRDVYPSRISPARDWAELRTPQHATFKEQNVRQQNETNMQIPPVARSALPTQESSACQGQKRSWDSTDSNNSTNEPEQKRVKPSTTLTMASNASSITTPNTTFGPARTTLLAPKFATTPPTTFAPTVTTISATPSTTTSATTSATDSGMIQAANMPADQPLSKNPDDYLDTIATQIHGENRYMPVRRAITKLPGCVARNCSHKSCIEGTTRARCKRMISEQVKQAEKLAQNPNFILETTKRGRKFRANGKTKAHSTTHTNSTTSTNSTTQAGSIPQSDVIPQTGSSTLSQLALNAQVPVAQHFNSSYNGHYQAEAGALVYSHLEQDSRLDNIDPSLYQSQPQYTNTDWNDLEVQQSFDDYVQWED